jgi:hypothetical protein
MPFETRSTTAELLKWRRTQTGLLQLNVVHRQDLPAPLSFKLFSNARVGSGWLPFATEASIDTQSIIVSQCSL